MIVVVVVDLLFCFLSCCEGGEMLTAFYVPEDLVALYPNDPNMTTNKELYHGFTLKDRIFKGKEYDEEVGFI